MPMAPWLRALNAVGTVAEATRMFRAGSQTRSAPSVTGGASDLERGLANVVVAALREAFDRDRARFELEREEREAVRAQAEREMRAARRQQVGFQTISQVRMLAAISVTVWVASAAAAGLLAPIGSTPTWMLGLGWLSLGGALGAAFVTHQQLTGWMSHEPDPSASAEPPRTTARLLLPWLVVSGFLVSAASVLLAL